MYPAGGRLAEWASAYRIGGYQPNDQRIVGKLLAAAQEASW